MASIKEEVKKDGTVVFKVRWYPNAHSNQKSKTYYDREDAEDWIRELKRAQSRGQPTPEPYRRKEAMTLGEWWLAWSKHPDCKWTPHTEQNYYHYYTAHVANEAYGIANEALTVLDVQTVCRFDANMAEAGAGVEVRRSSLALVSSLLSKAARYPNITGLDRNVLLGNKIKPGRSEQENKHPKMAFAPGVSELVRHELLSADDRSEDQRARDALWFSFGSLAGLRPEEIFAMTPGHVRENTIMVIDAVVHGELAGHTKNKVSHYPPLHPCLREELDAYLAAYPQGDDALLFPDPKRQGDPIADHNWRNWRKRVFHPARDRAVSRAPERVRADLLVARPYDLGRHSFASLRLRAGMSHNIAGLVAELGHKTMAQLAETYAHEIAEYRTAEPIDWVTEVRKARAAVAAES